MGDGPSSAGVADAPVDPAALGEMPRAADPRHALDAGAVGVRAQDLAAHAEGGAGVTGVDVGDLLAVGRPRGHRAGERADLVLIAAVGVHDGDLDPRPAIQVALEQDPGAV